MIKDILDPSNSAMENETPGGRPAYVPGKFWDDTTNTLRVSELCQSYKELERRLGSNSRVPSPEAGEEEKASLRRAMGVPDHHDAYELEMKDDLLERDDEVNLRLHSAGFNNEQVQLVYDLAAERVVPMLVDIADSYESDRDQSKLEAHFGGEERWAEMSHQIRAWAEKNLPEDVHNALRSSADGVISLHRMMTSGEPGLVNRSGGGDEPLSEERLKTMMRDPRYYEGKDPAYVRRISDGFKKLYPGEAG